MKYFLTLCFLFILGSLSGYILELIYRRYAHKKWINPGFLVGPYLPLYGCGVIALYGCTRLIEMFNFPNEIIKYVVLLVIIAIMMTLIEYITGLIFIVKMKIMLWDYSSRWGNIQGIICPLFSFFWAIIGAFYVFIIDPYLVDKVTWLMENLEWSFSVGFIMGIIFIDACYSFKLSLRIKDFATKNNIIVKYEYLKAHIRENADALKAKHSFLLPFKSSVSTLKESLISFKSKFEKNR